MDQVISDFEATYDKLLATTENGREPTPADLYKLHKYWQMQAQLKNEMQALGDKEIALLSEKFEKEWNDIYESFALTSKNSFSTISTRNAKAAINTAWLSDGKNFSQRVWNNTDKLVETLNDNLINCVITGKKTTELKQLLQKRFNVSYNAADMLVRTETAHIQTQAAAQRYKDYGLKEYEFLADPDERTCSVCAALDGKRFLLSEMKPGVNAPPMHPRDRCCIVPVVNKETEEEIMFDRENKEVDGYVINCPYCGKDFEMKYLANFTHCPHCGKSIYNPMESKTIYKDKNGNRKYYTDSELKAENEELKQMARNRAANKTTMGLTEEDAYTTKPLQKQIRDAYEKEGEFKYYTHHCNNCGRYFNSTVRDKKKCPLCGGSINDYISCKEHVIEMKKCKICGKLFKNYKSTEDLFASQQDICPDCRYVLLNSKDAEWYKKHGYNESGIIAELTNTPLPQYGYTNPAKKSNFDIVWDYIKEHPEEEEKIEAIPYFDREKHFYICIDCGKIVFVENAKNNAAKRCPECQAEYRRKYKAEKEKERRKKKKYNG